VLDKVLEYGTLGTKPNNYFIGGKRMKNVKKPCINCVYFKTCGSTTRTEPCAGRETKSDKKKNKNNI
jgi:hypothetical protein